MKKFFSVLLLLLVITAAVPAPAAAIPDTRQLPRLVDQADLLSSSEERALLKELDEVSERLGFDVVVVTAMTLGGKSPRAYADDFFDYNGYGFGSAADGALLLVSMEDRDWWISTSGYGITAITKAGISYIGEKLVPYLKDGEYAEAFSAYADWCEEFVKQAQSGEPYDGNHMPKEPFPAVSRLIFAVLIGLLIAWIVVSSMKGQLKSVRGQNAAASYVRSGSMNVTQRQDIFLYRHVSRRARPKDTGSSSGGGVHTSSSGRSHGGGGGKF